MSGYQVAVVKNSPRHNESVVIIMPSCECSLGEKRKKRTHQRIQSPPRITDPMLPVIIHITPSSEDLGSDVKARRLEQEPGGNTSTSEEGHGCGLGGSILGDR
jgi:hypothetical protein